MSEKIEVILVDIGNTVVKSVEVVDGLMGETRVWEMPSQIDERYDKKIPFMICSTRESEELVFKDRSVSVLSHVTPMPIELDYKTPKTLGPDRIAAAVGAMDLFPDQNSLILDLGTCMTVDLVTEKGVFQGGIISPGLKMRMRAMAHFTSKLPDISEFWQEIENDVFGKTTNECLVSGSYQGMLHEIRGIIAAFETNFTSINVILSGGDAHFFESKVKAHIFAGSKIVQKGLYRIWKY